jgi:hypothetical protein
MMASSIAREESFHPRIGHLPFKLGKIPAVNGGDKMCWIAA